MLLCQHIMWTYIDILLCYDQEGKSSWCQIQSADEYSERPERKRSHGYFN